MSIFRLIRVLRKVPGHTIRVSGLLILTGTAGAIFSPLLADNGLRSAAAEVRSVAHHQILEGVIEAINRSTVSAQISSRVTAIHFDVNDFVEQGAVIVAFDDTEFRARLRQAMATRQSALVSIDAARAQFTRIESLHARGTASQAEFDRATAELGTARAALDAAEASIAEIEQQLAYTMVRAPYSGIVTQRHIELGESASPGTPLMSGFSLQRLRAVVHVPQRLVSRIRNQPQARVLHGENDDQVIDATQVTIFPFAAAQTGTIEVRVSLPEDLDDVYPGMRVKVAFPIGQRSKLSIPESALVFRSEVVGVYVIGDDQRVGFRHVRPGHTDAEGMVEILAGLDEGEHVAIDPIRAAAMRFRSTDQN